MMIKFLKVSLVLFAGIFISCNKDDSEPITYVIPYATQYPKDLAKIETFLLEYHMEKDDITMDVEFTKLPVNNPPVGQTGHVMSIREQYIDTAPTPEDRFKMVRKHAVDYKIYYIPLREGVGPKPTRLDSTLVAYKGRLLEEDETTHELPVFDSAFNPVWFTLPNLVFGWREILTKFGAGNSDPNPDGTITYSDFGAGVFFLPSGLGYYNATQPGIKAYSPLIFNVKLMKINSIDHDFDGIDTKDEDLNNNGIFSDDDTDGDGKKNYLDQDDDGDAITTKNERKRPQILVNNVLVDNGYYPYNGAATDDLSTPNIDERQGIPRKFTGPLQNTNLPESSTNRRQPDPSDFTDPLRLRRHLDKTCKPPYL